MKKFIWLIIAVLLFPCIVLAGGNNDDIVITNACELENDVSCAFCVYKYAQDMGCFINFSVTYKSDSTPLVYKVYSSGSNSGYVNCTFNYNVFKKNDFKNRNGNIVCPKVNPTSEITSSSGRTAYQTITLSPSINGSLSATSESSTKKVNSTNNQQNENAYVCNYSGGNCDAFTVSVVNGVVYVDPSSIKHSLTSDIFSNNTCPKLYTREVDDVCYVSSTLQSSFVPTSGTLVNQNTGTEDNYTSNLNPTDMEDCTDLLGDPDISNTPSWYLVRVFRVLKYVAIVLLVVLSIMDFVGAVASSDNDAIKKATAKAIKRFILCIIIFILPTLIEFVLGIIHDEAVGMCGIGG